MAERDDARSYSDRGALREPSRPKAFDRSDDEAVILGCQQAIQSSKALLLRPSEASMRPSPTVKSDHHDGDLLQVFYSSRVPKAKNLHQTQDDIDNILRISRKENAERGITGILVANMKMYSQIIEGPSGYIKELVGRISCDARHHDIRVISRDIAKTRLFPDWSMSFMLTDLELEIYNDRKSNLNNKKASDILSFCSSIGIKTI